MKLTRLLDNEHVRLWLWLSLWSAAVLMLMSMDSPLHHIYNRVDSAIFFMCGKAMMNGLCPYVDFSDSKGPLLWLIYGVGYLLSPRNYVGVYVLSCFFYGGILYYNYLTARLFLGDDRRPLIVALLMPLAYFLYWFHTEVRAEDFCSLFVAASMYHLFLMLYGSGAAAAQRTGGEEAEATLRTGGEEAACTVRRHGLVLGGCFMALVLIKWNIAVMQGSMIAVALWYYVRKDRQSLLPFLGWTAAGMCAVALPFVVYLLVMGSLPAFIEEYFVRTVQTVQTPHGMPETYQDDFAKAWDTPERQFLLLAIVGGGWLLGRRVPRFRYVPMLLGLFFYAVSVRHSFSYYYSICNIFLVYVLIYLVSHVGRQVKAVHLALAAALVIAWGIFENNRDDSRLKVLAIWATGDDKKHYEEAANIAQAMSGRDKPRVMNLFFWELGLEVPCEGIPAGKYFTYQNGMTPEMDAEHVALLKSGQADFIIVGDTRRCNKKGYTRQVIESCGYRLILRQGYTSEGSRRPVAVYERK